MNGSGDHDRASASVLGGSPEIAVLDGLGHTLRIAIAVTRALNPELAVPWSAACPLRAPLCASQSRRRCGCCVVHREHLGAPAEQPGIAGAQRRTVPLCATNDL